MTASVLKCNQKFTYSIVGLPNADAKAVTAKPRLLDTSPSPGSR